MIQHWLAKFFLFPFSLIYGLGVSIRNSFYETGMLKGSKFNLPVINVGNLTVGGAGKTPHIEYLILLLREYLNIATLSRGYKRKSKGFRLVQQRDQVSTVGDEPLQFKRKFSSIVVAVAESRNIGIPQLVQKHPNLQGILLDDAFQHRSVIPGLNILLTEFNNPFFEDYLLPMGRLREGRASYNRADIIIVSKCPNHLSELERSTYKKEINPLPHQTVFFSKYEYLQPYLIFDFTQKLVPPPNSTIILISAIASTDYLLDYLHNQFEEVISMKYEDHHYYTGVDLEQLTLTFNQIENPNKYIITTEKDGIRLGEHYKYIQQKNLPIYILPIKVAFLDSDGLIFDDLLKKFFLNFTV